VLSPDVVNFDEGSFENIQELLQETQMSPNVTQESMRVHKLMLLLDLLVKHTKGKKPLIDYSQSHVMISSEYLNILRRKTMEKAIVEEIRVGKLGEGKQASQMNNKIGFYNRTNNSKNY
jgi:hypothetical protein